MDKIKHITEYDNTNFWDANPQFCIISPFDELHKLKNIDSSKAAWCILLFCETSDKSIFAQFPEDKRKEELSYYYPDMPWNDDIIKRCLEKYPFIAMSAAARSLKEEEDILMRRAVFLRDEYDRAIQERNIALTEKLEKMLKNNGALYDNLEKAMEKFAVEKAKATLRGGRVESLTEQGLL